MSNDTFYSIRVSGAQPDLVHLISKAVFCPGYGQVGWQGIVAPLVWVHGFSIVLCAETPRVLWTGKSMRTGIIDVLEALAAACPNLVFEAQFVDPWSGLRGMELYHSGTMQLERCFNLGNEASWFEPEGSEERAVISEMSEMARDITAKHVPICTCKAHENDDGDDGFPL